MVNLELNKEYPLKLGEANPVDSVYLGIKRYKGNVFKHVFIVYDWCNRTYTDYRFYLGEINNTVLKEGTVYIKNPVYKKVKTIEERVLISGTNNLRIAKLKNLKNQ